MPKKKKKFTYKQIVGISLELQRRVIWALKFMRFPGGGGLVCLGKGGKRIKTQHWTEWFADGAEMLKNCKVDRELVGLSTADFKKVLKRREKEKLTKSSSK